MMNEWDFDAEVARVTDKNIENDVIDENEFGEDIVIDEKDSSEMTPDEIAALEDEIEADAAAKVKAEKEKVKAATHAATAEKMAVASVSVALENSGAGAMDRVLEAQNMRTSEGIMRVAAENGFTKDDPVWQIIELLHLNLSITKETEKLAGEHRQAIIEQTKNDVLAASASAIEKATLEAMHEHVKKPLAACIDVCNKVFGELQKASIDAKSRVEEAASIAGGRVQAESERAISRVVHASESATEHVVQSAAQAISDIETEDEGMSFALKSMLAVLIFAVIAMAQYVILIAAPTPTSIAVARIEQTLAQQHEQQTKNNIDVFAHAKSKVTTKIHTIKRF